MSNTTVDGQPAQRFTVSNLPALPGSPPATALRILAYDGKVRHHHHHQLPVDARESQVAGCDEVLASMQLR